MIEVTYEVSHYRKKLAEIIKTGDNVVEIGPHIGKSTDAYINKAKKTVLVDKGTDCLTHLTQYCEKHQNAVYVCGDCRSFDTLKLVQKHIEYCDLFAVDMGGGRYPDTVFKVWATWASVLEPKNSIIRCRGLAEFIRRAKVSDISIPKNFKENGWLKEYGRRTPQQMKEQLDEFTHYVDV